MPGIPLQRQKGVAVMSQPGFRPTSSRGRNNRPGVIASRSGERVHGGMGAENASMAAASTAASRAKASRTAGMTSAGATGKPGISQERRRAFGDKTNVQQSNVSSHHGQGQSKGDQPMKHKLPASSSVIQPTAQRRDQVSRPVTLSQQAERPAAVGSHSRQASSQPVSGASSRSRTTSVDVKIAGESSSHRDSAASTASSATFGDRRGSHQALPQRLLPLQQRPTNVQAIDAITADTQSSQQDLKATRAEAQRHLSPALSIDDDYMSEIDSTDWRSSTEAVSRPLSSCETETEDEEDTSDAKAAGLLSSDEELGGDDIDDADETDMSDDESVYVNDLDPECIISLPPDLEALARNRVAHISARFEESILRPAAERQAVERQAALQRGEITPETAAHDDELQLMGLDPDEVRDTSMVAEYADEIFEYMSKCESRTMANPHYMDFQGEIRWHMRATLVDWLMQVHMRYHMMPETLWIAINVVDRFLSARVVSLAKLQLVGVTAMFIAAKYEEIMSPVVDEFVYMTESGYTRDEILKGERIILSTLDFNVSTYCSPYSWVRRISKADDYDIQTRTLAKFLMELTLFDHRFLRVKPSQIAAIGMYLSKKMLGGQWNDGFVFYSGFVEEQLIPGANLLLERLVDDAFLDCFVCKKYGNRRFLKASIFARDWALRNQESILAASNSQGSMTAGSSGASSNNSTQEMPLGNPFQASAGIRVQS